jgi:two-component system nitrogen regulation response regulator NtrX
VPEAVAELKQYARPGNVRELCNVVERLLLLCPGDVDAAAVRLTLPLLGSGVQGDLSTGGTQAQRVEDFERKTLLAELNKHPYQMTETARALGLERSHLCKKCHHLGIDLQSPGEKE